MPPLCPPPCPTAGSVLSSSDQVALQTVGMSASHWTLSPLLMWRPKSSSPAVTRGDQYRAVCIHNAQETAAEPSHWLSSWQHYPGQKAPNPLTETQNLQESFSEPRWVGKLWLWSPIELSSNTNYRTFSVISFFLSPHSPKAASSDILFHHCPLGGPGVPPSGSRELVVLISPGIQVWWHQVGSLKLATVGAFIPQKLEERYQSGLCFFSGS